MKIKRIISAILTLVMLLSSLAVSVDAAEEEKKSKVDEDGNPVIDYLSKDYESPAEKLYDMTLVQEAYGYQLYIEEFTGEIAVVNTTTGEAVFSNPYDINSGYQNISETIKQELLSQIILTYSGSEGGFEMNSYEEAALRNQITVKKIKGGIRVEYILGEEQTTRLVPRYIRKDRFEELILANIDNSWAYSQVYNYYLLYDKDDPSLTARGRAEMVAKFPITEQMAVYVCDPDVNTRELRAIEDYIKQYCPAYTYEELEYDHDITNYEGDSKAPPRFRMAFEYKLNEFGLEVRLPANGIEFDESAYQFGSMEILPYFGSASNEYEGYTFLPDGSGTIIRYEDFIGKAVNISGNIYGVDYAYHNISAQNSETMRMPCYGIVTTYDQEMSLNVVTYEPPEEGEEEDEDAEAEEVEEIEEIEEETDNDLPQVTTTTGFLAVITEGDSLAKLMAECGGNLHPYNTVYAMFTPRPSDTYNIADSVSVSGVGSWSVTSKRKYTESYRIQYIFLNDTRLAEEYNYDDGYDADWVGMATAYRDYLTEKGDITKLEEAKEDIPLFIETFGSFKTYERVLSFPVYVDTPLTTFEDIKTMYTELTELGVGNVNFKMTGYANGGMDTTYPYRLKWVDVVGGNDGFTELAAYAEENGFDIYPDFDFAYIDMTSEFDGVSLKKHAVRTIDDRYIRRRGYDPATQTYEVGFGVAFSPVFYETLYDVFGQNYLKYGNDSISAATLGTDLNSDFDEDDPYHREDNKGFTVDLLARLDEDYENVMIEGGNAYAIKYADVILGASLTSSEHSKASQSVPFFGMVYHGSKVITGSATNMEGDINEAILQAIENGAGMYFILSYQNTSKLKDDVEFSKYYSVSYDIWKEDVAKYYTILNDAIKDLQTSYIVDHEFIDAERIPDADELEADRLAAEEAARLAAEEEAKKLADEERAKRLEERLAAELGYAVDNDDEVIDEEPAEDGEELDEELADGVTVNEFGEEIIVEKEEEVNNVDKYKTTVGSVVRVEYEGGVNFILNYNSFAITVEYEGQTYDIDGLGFVRID